MVKLRSELEENSVTTTTGHGHKNGTPEKHKKVDRKRRKSDKIVTYTDTSDKSLHIDKNGTVELAEEEDDEKALRKERKRRKSEKIVVDNIVELQDDPVSSIHENGTAEKKGKSKKEKSRKSSGKVKNVEVDVDESEEEKAEEVVDKIDKSNETEEEKLIRRKLERRRRRSGKLEKSGKPLPLPNTLIKRFNLIWDRETKFVSETLQVLPEVRRPHLFDDEEDKIEEYLLEEESAKKTEKKRAKFLAKMKERQGGSEQPTRALTHEELKERLHAKIASLGQKRNERKHERRLKKLARTKEGGEETSDKKKKFISKANPNLKNQQKGQQHNLTLKDEKATEESSSRPTLEKTPLRKKPVVKSNGEVVYSKFDFISADSTNPASKMNGGLGVKKSKPKAEDLLKTVQKTESKIARLETEGRRSEAVSLVETTKWDSALKRAQGEKIRDDPTLLKKTIKKQEKRKQVSKKKWVERTENVQKQKEVKQEKRKANIQSRKDDKVKKVKKQQRKKGRAA